jgi:hypothetical protein
MSGDILSTFGAVLKAQAAIARAYGEVSIEDLSIMLAALRDCRQSITVFESEVEAILKARLS